MVATHNLMGLNRTLFPGVVRQKQLGQLENLSYAFSGNFIKSLFKLTKIVFSSVFGPVGMNKDVIHGQNESLDDNILFMDRTKNHPSRCGGLFWIDRLQVFRFGVLNGESSKKCIYYLRHFV